MSPAARPPAPSLRSGRLTTSSVSAGLALRPSVSPTQMIGVSPARQRRLGLGAHQRRRFRHDRRAVRNGRRSRSCAPASQHLGGDVAGMGAARRRDGNPAPPACDRRPCAGLGGPRDQRRRQTEQRRRPGRDLAGSAARDRVDLGEATRAVPFIFQLPATSGLIPGVMPLSRLPTCPVLLPKSVHKAIDTGLQGGYCLLGEGRRPAAPTGVG